METWPERKCALVQRICSKKCTHIHVSISPLINGNTEQVAQQRGPTFVARKCSLRNSARILVISEISVIISIRPQHLPYNSSVMLASIRKALWSPY
jgi:hypothetical protein